MSETDKQILLGYRNIVFQIHSILQHMVWNLRHDLPVLTMPAQIAQLKQQLLRAEYLLDTIPDRRSRIIIRCRFVLGLNDSDTAFLFGLSRGQVSRICAAILGDTRLQRRMSQ